MQFLFLFMVFLKSKCKSLDEIQLNMHVFILMADLVNYRKLPVPGLAVVLMQTKYTLMLVT